MSYWRASVFHHGKRVSRAHAVVLAACERSRRQFIYLNQGRRTIAEQWGFWNHYKQYGWPLAAYPAPSAPHIKYGQANHALDINAPQPAHEVAAFYQTQGIVVAFNVPSEAWHMDTLYETQLIAAARRLSGPGPRPTLRRGAKGTSVAQLQNLLRAKHVQGAPATTGFFGPATLKAVRRFQRKHGLPPLGVVGPRTWKKLLA